MKNIYENTADFSYQDIRPVILMLLKVEMILNGKMQSKLDHPDARFTIILKESGLQLRLLLNRIMKDELVYLESPNTVPAETQAFLQNIMHIAANVQGLLLLTESFQFEALINEGLLDQIKKLSSWYYGEDIG